MGDWPNREAGREAGEDNEKELSISIPETASFADLFDAIDAIEEKTGLDELHFEEELWDNFDDSVAETVLSFRDKEKSNAADTNVIDFFKERGYSKDDISTYLPIEFR